MTSQAVRPVLRVELLVILFLQLFLQLVGIKIGSQLRHVNDIIRKRLFLLMIKHFVDKLVQSFRVILRSFDDCSKELFLLYEC